MPEKSVPAATAGFANASPTSLPDHPPVPLTPRIQALRAELASTRERLDAFVRRVRAFEIELKSTRERVELFAQRARAPGPGHAIPEGGDCPTCHGANPSGDRLQPVRSGHEQWPHGSSGFALLARHRLNLAHLCASRPPLLMNAVARRT